MSAYTKMSGKFFVRLPFVSVKLSAKGMGHRSADSESGVRNQYVSHFCRNMSLSTATIDVKKITVTIKVCFSTGSDLHGAVFLT